MQKKVPRRQKNWLKAMAKMPHTYPLAPREA
jgi:hypothetical protein